jgi:hypothetical protein
MISKNLINTLPGLGSTVAKNKDLVSQEYFSSAASKIGVVLK